MPQDPIKIIMIEDDKKASELVGQALKHYFKDNLTLTVHTHLKDGLEHFQSADMDVLLLDLELPDSDRDNTMAFIDQYKSDIPIVVMSSEPDEESRLEAIKKGAQDYLIKQEIDTRLLPMTLRYAIERHGLKQELEEVAEELQDKQQKLIEAQAIAQLGSWELDVFNMTFHWSVEAMNILELRPTKFSSTMKEFLDSVFNTDQKTLREIFRQAIEENSDFNVDIAVVMSDLSLKYINLRVRSSLERELDKKVIMGTLQDISFRKKIEEALKKSEEKYHTLFEQSRDAIYITSRDGSFMDFNDATTDLFGYTAEEMESLNVKDLYLNPFERVKFRKEIEDHGFVRDFELKLRRKDGGKIDCVITSNLWRSNDGKKLGYQGIIRDITEKRQAEELKKEKEIAEQSSKMKEQFLANMSHEIRTPINAISGLTHLLAQTELNEQQKDYVTGVKSSSQHLLELVNDILDFTKIEAGKVTFESFDFSMVNILQQVTNTLRFRALDKKIELILDMDPSMPETLKGDPLRLKQILINLLTNAIKFTNVGHVKISAKVVEKAKKDVVFVFTVEDTGIGIPEDKLHKIFSSFTQLGYGVTKQAEGTGLGLTITKQLVELQGGTISLKSKVGEGSTFKVTMKYRISDAQVSNDPGEENFNGKFEVQDIGHKRILIVEDKKLNQLVAKEMIQQWWPNVTVDVADNGRIAVEKVERYDFDIVLMDVQMPEMDGYEATKAIRSRFMPPTSTMPILAMTAYATTGEAQKCIDAGMNDYVPKPFEPKVLHDKVISLIYNKPAAAKTAAGVAASTTNAQEATPTDDIEFMDMGYLNQMTAGNESLKGQIIDLLLIETPEELDKLKSLTNDENWARVRGISHKMKSSATYMGMPNTLKLLKAIEEQSGAERNVAAIPDMVRRVSKNFNHAMTSLKDRKEA